MHSPGSARSLENARGLTIKRRNAVVAICTGTILACASLGLFRPPMITPPWIIPLVISALALGLFCGGVYANAFEYILHRFFLHGSDSFLVRRHALHHDSAGALDEARYVNFATSPWVVAGVFALNALPVFGGLFILRQLLPTWWRATSLGAFGAGIFLGFTGYYVLYEEIHWRIHMGGWIPQRLGFARRHHLRHHGEVEGCYNVFLPLCDRLIASFEKKHRVPQAR